MSIFGGGSSGGSTPTPPKFKPIDISGVANQAYQADVLGYNLSDADLAARFPGLVAARQSEIDSAYKNLTGPLDPAVQNTFVNQGLQQSLSSYGGGNPAAKINKGSAAQNAVSTSLANNVQKKQDYDRTYFEQTLGYNPQRQFGLTGEDAVNFSIANLMGQNAAAQQAYLGKVGAANASQASSNSQWQAALQAAVQVGAAVAMAYSDKRIKEGIKTVGKTPDGKIPIKSFKYKTDPKHKRHVGLIAQDVEKVKPEAVATDPVSGLKMIDYAQLYRGVGMQ